MNSILLIALISNLCTSSIADERNACSSGLESTFRQSGIDNKVREWEIKQEKRATKKADKYIQKNHQEIITGTFILTRIAGGSNTLISLGTGKFGESYYWDFSINNNRLGLNWEF